MPYQMLKSSLKAVYIYWLYAQAELSCAKRAIFPTTNTLLAPKSYTDSFIYLCKICEKSRLANLREWSDR